MRATAYLLLFVPAMLGGCTGPARKSDEMTAGPDTVDLRGDKTTCEIHGAALLEEKQDAMPRFSVSWVTEYYEARRTRFPNLGTPPFGINDTNVKWAIVQYCPQCRRAVKEWSEDQERQRAEKTR